MEDVFLQELVCEDGAWVLGAEGILTEDETYHTLKVEGATLSL